MNLTLSHRIFVAVLVQLAAFMLPGHAQAQPSNEAIWQQFVQWLPSAPPLDNPGPLFNQYRSRLIADGASAAEADRQMVIIRSTMQERPDGWRIIFNNIYSTSTPGFSTQPNIDRGRPQAGARIRHRNGAGPQLGISCAEGLGCHRVRYF